MKNNKGQENLVKMLQSLLNTKTHDVFPKKYSVGGSLLSTLSSFIPGVGSIVSPLIGMIDQSQDVNEQVPVEQMKLNTNVFGNQFAKGGLVTKNFKQYDTGSHTSGNDQLVAENGVPSANATASVQNKENAYTQKGKTYIYSDTLVNPETGRKFNEDSAKLNKKYSKSDTSIEDKNALDFTMSRLAKANDMVRSVEESTQKYEGGPTVPDSENLAWKAQSLDPNTMFVPPLNMDEAPSFEDMNTTANSLSKSYNKMPNLNPLALPGLTKPSMQLPKLNTVTPPDPNKALDRLQGKTNVTSKGMDYNVPAGILKGLALGKSVIDALTPAEKEKTILPDYRKSDEQMYGMNVDYTQSKQDAVAASNLASNMNRSASGNFSQFQGRQSANFANVADALGNISMKENLDRNQQRMSRAGYEQGKAVDTANRNTQNRINNQQNQANADFADEKLFSEIADIGSQFNKYEYYKDMVANKKEIAQATINEGLQLIGSKYSNFGFDDDFINKIKSGTASVDELVKFMSTVDQVKSKKGKE